MFSTRSHSSRRRANRLPLLLNGDLAVAVGLDGGGLLVARVPVFDPGRRLGIVTNLTFHAAAGQSHTEHGQDAQAEQGAEHLVSSRPDGRTRVVSSPQRDIRAAMVGTKTKLMPSAQIERVRASSRCKRGSRQEESKRGVRLSERAP